MCWQQGLVVAAVLLLLCSCCQEGRLTQTEPRVPCPPSICCHKPSRGFWGTPNFKPLGQRGEQEFPEKKNMAPVTKWKKKCSLTHYKRNEHENYIEILFLIFRLSKTQKFDNRVWWKTSILIHCWWECVLIHCWWQYLAKVHIYSPFKPESHISDSVLKEHR